MSPDVPEKAQDEAARRRKVTVLMPVRNGALHLRPSLDSILSQTFTDLEVLVIDDGSEDETPEILRAYAERDRRIRVINQEPAGLVKTLNRGLAESRTELIARQDADDLSESTRIEKQVAYLHAHPDVALVGTSVQVFTDSGDRSWVAFPTEHEQISDGMLLGNMFAHGSVMLRKGAVLEVGGYSEARYAEDFDLWIRLARKYRVGNLREYLYRYRRNPQGFSSVNAVKQASDARSLITELCGVRGYRDFWAVPGYSMRRWATGGLEDDGESAARFSREDLQRSVSAMRFLWTIGERRAALRRLNALIRYRPISFGRVAAGRLVRRISQGLGLGADRRGQES